MLLAAAAAIAAPLTPAGPWYVDEEESLCTLGRRYPAGETTVTLVFKPLLDLPSMEVFVVTPDKSDRQYTGTFAAQIGTDGPHFTGSYFSVRATKSTDRYTRLSIERAVLDQLRDGDQLHIKAAPVDQTFTIRFPDKARLALQGCVDALKKSWGVDTAFQNDTATPLTGNPGRYFNAQSYPPEALRNGVYGRVVALLNIDQAGAVTHCRIVSSAGQSLNDGTCKAAMQIRFKPPRDHDGNAMPSTYVLPVRWLLPGMTN